MLQHIFQQRYFSDKGWIIIAQEGLDPAAGEQVFTEEGQPAPDGEYTFHSSDWKQSIEVREGVVHHYHKRRIDKSISAGSTFTTILLFVILLLIAFRILGRHM
jgi:hypothetical protein